jgi:hypothetical protein
MVAESKGKVKLFDLASGTMIWTFYLGGKYSLAASVEQASEHLMKNLEKQIEKSASSEELEAQRKIAADLLKVKLEGTRHKMEAAMKQIGGGTLPDFDTGMAPACALAFNADESQLFVGIHSGCMVFDWSEIRHSANPTHRTFISPRFSDDPNFGSRVHSLAFDAPRNVLLMGGNGKLNYYDVHRGKTGVLLTPPTPTIFYKLCLSPDRSALACVCYSVPDRDIRNDRSAPELQVWNYAALLKEASLS